MVDYDHELVLASQQRGRAEAAGWIKELQVRQDGIYGRVEWTAAAAEKIANKAYRYLSPWFQALKNGRVYKLLNAALVNMPALELIAANLEIPTMENPSLEAQLRELLALADDADATAILEAVRALSAKAETASVDPAAYVPMAMFTDAVAEANRLRQGISEQDAKHYVASKIDAGLMVPAMESWAVNLCMVNRPAFDSFLANTGPAIQRLFTTRQSRSAFPEREHSGLNAVEAEIAANLNLSTEQFIAAGVHAVTLDPEDRR